MGGVGFPELQYLNTEDNGLVAAVIVAVQTKSTGQRGDNLAGREPASLLTVRT